MGPPHPVEGSAFLTGHLRQTAFACSSTVLGTSESRPSPQRGCDGLSLASLPAGRHRTGPGRPPSPSWPPREGADAGPLKGKANLSLEASSSLGLPRPPRPEGHAAHPPYCQPMLPWVDDSSSYELCHPQVGVATGPSSDFRELMI